MNEATILKAARATHEANRILCEALGDMSQPRWDDAPGWQKESAIAGVQGIAAGTITKPSESHESWLAHKTADGWQYGETKDPAAKRHPCMVPYEKLPESQRRKDDLFFLVARLALGM